MWHRTCWSDPKEHVRSAWRRSCKVNLVILPAVPVLHLKPGWASQRSAAHRPRWTARSDPGARATLRIPISGAHTVARSRLLHPRQRARGDCAVLIVGTPETRSFGASCAAGRACPAFELQKHARSPHGPSPDCRPPPGWHRRRLRPPSPSTPRPRSKGPRAGPPAPRRACPSLRARIAVSGTTRRYVAPSQAPVPARARTLTVVVAGEEGRQRHGCTAAVGKAALAGDDHQRAGAHRACPYRRSQHGAHLVPAHGRSAQVTKHEFQNF